jgi:integrase
MESVAGPRHRAGREHGPFWRSAMSESHPTPSTPPVKPRPDFPLHAHASGQWAKKIRGRRYYFGVWSDPEGAERRYREQAEALHAGRKPRDAGPAPDGATVKDAANIFLNHKKSLLDAGELSPRTWREYRDACDLLVSAFGKGRLLADLGPDDFAALRGRMTRRWGPVRVGNVIQVVRGVFRHADAAELTARPVRYGPAFKRPSAKTLRLEKAKAGPKLFTAEEVRRLLGAAGPAMRAMILLAVNAGYGNADVGRLPLSALDLDAGWASFARPKTGIPRRCPLWPETVAAIREALAVRPDPKRPEDAGLVFVTKRGLAWAKDNPTSPVSQMFTKLARRLGVNGSRGYYSLRHTFRTVADAARDQPACDHIMGHLTPGLSSTYRELIDDDRLRAVAEHVRKWLFGPTAAV